MRDKRISKRGHIHFNRLTQAILLMSLTKDIILSPSKMVIWCWLHTIPSLPLAKKTMITFVNSKHLYWKIFFFFIKNFPNSGYTETQYILRISLLETSKSVYRSVKCNRFSPKCAKNKNICILFQVSKDLFLLFQLNSFIIHEINQNLPKVV